MATEQSARAGKWEFVLNVVSTAAMVTASSVLIWAVVSARAAQATTKASAQNAINVVTGLQGSFETRIRSKLSAKASGVTSEPHGTSTSRASSA